MARLTPAKSPRGAMIGIASVACPEEDGTKNASGMFTRYITTANAPDGSPDTTDSSPCSTESVIEALFIMVVTPRATAMISAARARLDDEGQDLDQHQHQEQHGERGGELEPALGLRSFALWTGPGLSRHASPCNPVVTRAAASPACRGRCPDSFWNPYAASSPFRG